MQLFPNHSKPEVRAVQIQMRSAHMRNKSQDQGAMRFLDKAGWGTPARFLCAMNASHIHQELLRVPQVFGFLGTPEYSVPCCKKTTAVWKVWWQNVSEQIYLSNILWKATSSKITTKFTRERAYTNRAELLDVLSLQFFPSFFLPPFAKRWKWNIFSYRRCLGHGAVQQWSTHTIHEACCCVFFPPSAGKIQLFKESSLISYCTLIGKAKRGRGCFIPFL